MTDTLAMSVTQALKSDLFKCMKFYTLLEAEHLQ